MSLVWPFREMVATHHKGRLGWLDAEIKKKIIKMSVKLIWQEGDLVGNWVARIGSFNCSHKGRLSCSFDLTFKISIHPNIMPLSSGLYRAFYSVVPIYDQGFTKSSRNIIPG